MAPSQTAEKNSLTFTLPEGPGTLEFVARPSTDDGETTTRTYLPPGSSFGPPPHWHQTHVEGFRIVQGYARITMGNTTRILGPSDGDTLIPPWVPHSFTRADCSPVAMDATALAAHDAQSKGWRDADVVMEEWTVPSDGEKEIFFRNQVSFYIDEIEPMVRRGVRLADVPALVLRILHSLVIQQRLDTYVLIVGGGWGLNRDGTVNRLGRWVTYAVLKAATLVNFVAYGGRLWEKEYTPRRLWPTCVQRMGE